MRASQKIISVFLIAFLILSVTAAAMLLPVPDKAKENNRADNSPAIEEAEGHLVLTPPGLEKKVFVHYAKPPCDNDGVCEAGEKKNCADCKGSRKEPTPTCYSFLGKGVKWKELPVGYVIDPDNLDGLTQEFIISAISAGAGEWDSHTSAELFSTYSIDLNSSWDDDAPDGRNELLFDNFPEQGVIAVTVTWGYFTGPPGRREIIEFDILFDTDFVWGDATADSSLMDLQNITAHEIGHGIGLADIYETACSEVTMYGYSEEGETKKRTLETADITALQELYGS